MSAKAHVKVVDKDHGWIEILKRVKEAKDGRVKVGVLADDPKGGEHVEGEALTVAELATLLHFGTETIAARPYLAMAFDQHREELSKLGGELMAQVIEGKMPLDRALGLMGAKLSAEAKKVITVGRQLEANKPSTVARKGSDRPLVDTGRLLNANTWVIDHEGK